MAQRRVKQRRLGRILVVGLLSTSLGLGAFRIMPAAADTVSYGTLGYPHSSMPCAHTLVNNICPGFDYGPVKDSDPKYSVATTYSARKYGYRNCVDYVAWKLQSQGIADVKLMGLGSGGEWAANASSKRISVLNTPLAGSAAVSLGSPGHVAYIESVNGNGTITVSEYNHNQRGDGDTRTGTAGAMGFTKFVDFGLRPSTSTAITAGIPRKHTADLNADGTDDLLLMTKDADPATGANPGLSTGSGLWMKPEWWHDPYTDWDTMTPLTGDVTNDGKADLVYLVPTATGTQAWVAPSTGSGFQSPQLWWNGEGYQYWNIKPALGDMDANGTEDLVLALNTTGTTFSVALSNGTGFRLQPSWWVDPYTDWEHLKFFAGDINGDGTADLTFVVPTSWGSAAYVLKSTNRAFVRAEQWWNGGIWWDNIKLLCGDIDGNGYTDALFATAEPGGGTALSPAVSTGAGFWFKGQWWNDPYTDWNVMKPFAGNYTGDKNGNNSVDDFGFIVPSSVGPRTWVLPSSRTGLRSPQIWWGNEGWGFDGIKLAVR